MKRTFISAAAILAFAATAHADELSDIQAQARQLREQVLQEADTGVRWAGCPLPRRVQEGGQTTARASEGKGVKDLARGRAQEQGGSFLHKIRMICRHQFISIDDMHRERRTAIFSTKLGCALCGQIRTLRTDGHVEILAQGVANVFDVSLNYPVIRQRQQNLFLRRARFFLGGQVAKDVTFFFMTDNPNLGKSTQTLTSGTTGPPKRAHAPAALARRSAPMVIGFG